MYATCLHCHHALGRNESIEAFPVGERLAFDADKGRLWVVCAACGRWNLTPIEERWEAIEQSERLFRGQKLRAQTDNVGLAKLRDGTELIRIGKPLRPEFAAWRYGAVFRRRLQRRAGVVAVAGTAIGAGALALGGAPVTAWELGIAPALMLPFLQLSVVGVLLRNNLGATRIVGEDGKPIRVTRANLEHSRLTVSDGDELAFHVQHLGGHEDLRGDRAVRAAASILAAVNRGGASMRGVQRASAFIADAGDPVGAVAAVTVEAGKRSGDFEERAAEFARGPHARTLGEALNRRMQIDLRSREALSNMPPTNRGALFRLPRVHRLALEMALHESSERHALDEELASLERAWREAEEIAAIADNLLVPKHVQSAIDSAKSRSAR